MKRRILAMLLSVIMLIGILPVSVLAVKEIASGKCGDNLTWKLTDDGVLTISGEGEVPYNGCPWENYTSAIQHVVYEEGITAIGDGDQFRFCENLISISVPASVTFLDWDRGLGIMAFYGLMSLDKIIVDEDNPNYCSDENGNLYSKDKSVLYKHLSEVDDCYIIPEYVTSIFDDAFGHENLVEVRVHENVESIGMYAFSNCSNLAKFVVDENNEHYCSDENGVLFSKDMKWLEFVPAKVTGTIVIPASVKNISYNALFYISEGSVVRFEGDAVEAYNCLPYDVTVYYPENNPTWTEEARIILGDGCTWIGYISDEPVIVATGKCGDDLMWELTIGGTLIISGEGEMYDFYQDADDSWDEYIVTDVIIKEGVTSIGNDAFSSKSIMNVSIPNTVTRIGIYAFSYCYDLNYIYIPSSVLEIGERAFWGSLRYISVDEKNPNYSSDNYSVLYNKEMTEIIHVPSGIWGEYIIPDTITHLDYATFYLTSSELECLTIPASVISIDNAFIKCSLGKIVVDEDNPNYSSDEGGALLNKDMTELIYVPGGVEKEITIHANVEKINEGAFDDVLEIGAVNTVRFKGNAPSSESDDPFWGREVTAYYPVGNPTWTEEAMASIGENITWIPYNLKGDVDSNGEVSNADLISVARYIVELYDENTVADIEKYGDMNGDGLVNNNDLVSIARIIVGLD